MNPQQATLNFDLPLKPPTFHGPGLDVSDTIRLTEHLRRFIAYVSDGRERTLRQVADYLGMMETSASARWRQIKDLGGDYEKRKDEKVKGLYWYKLTQVPEGYEK